MEQLARNRRESFKQISAHVEARGWGGAPKRFHVLDPQNEHTRLLFPCSHFFFKSAQAHVRAFYSSSSSYNYYYWCNFLNDTLHVKYIHHFLNTNKLESTKIQRIYALFNFAWVPHKTSPMDPCRATDLSVMGLNFSEHMRMPSNTLWCTLKYVLS